MPDLLGGFAYTWPWYLTIALAFLLGSIPFGLLLTRFAGLGDIRDIGSGNIGATNVLRTGRKWLALTTLSLDGAKGAGAVLGAAYYGPDFAGAAAVAVVLGHVLPPWLKFRGGKGVATSLGALAALSWPVAIAAALTWLAVAAASRYSSLAALIALPSAPAWLVGLLHGQRDGTLPIWLPGEPSYVQVLLIVAAIVVVRHAANIGRLLRGAETKIGARKSE